MALKSNRTVALTRKTSAKAVSSAWTRCRWKKTPSCKSTSKGSLPVVLAKQVFTNKDGSTGVLYLASSDILLDYGRITAIYQKAGRLSALDALLTRKPHDRLALRLECTVPAYTDFRIHEYDFSCWLLFAHCDDPAWRDASCCVYWKSNHRILAVRQAEQISSIIPPRPEQAEGRSPRIA